MPPFRDDHILVRALHFHPSRFPSAPLSLRACIQIIAPGSQTTLAQLGLPESFTPPKLRIPSRMFPGIDEGTWTFTKIREARDGEKEDFLAQAKGQQSGEDDADQGDDDEDEDDEEGDVKEGEMKEYDVKEGEMKEYDVKEGEVKEGELKEGSTPTPAATSTEKKDEPSAQDDMPDDMDEDMGDGVYVEDEDDEEGAVWCLKEGRVTDWGCFFAMLYATTITPPSLIRADTRQNLRA